MNLFELHYIITNDFGSEKVDVIINKLKEILKTLEKKAKEKGMELSIKEKQK